MFISIFRGSPHLASVYCQSRHVSCALDTSVHEECMLKKEEVKISSMKIFKSLFRKRKFKVQILSRVKIQHQACLKIISLIISFISVCSVIPLLWVAGSQPVTGADNCPLDTSETLVSNTLPTWWCDNPGQHPGWGWGSQPYLHTIVISSLMGDINNLDDLDDLVLVVGRTGSQAPSISILGDGVVLGGLGGFGRVPTSIITMDSVWVVIGGLGGLGHALISLIGGSNSPMPSPVGGILDTPIVTFHSRIPEDLSLRISSTNTGLTVSAGCPGLRVYVDQSAPWSHSEILYHDELSTEVVTDRLLAHELTCLIQIEMFIFDHAMLFLLCQVQIRHHLERKQVKR